MITQILMVLACACLFMQAFQINVKNIEIGWLGLFFWCLAVTLPLVNHTTQLVVLLLVILLIAIVLMARLAESTTVFMTLNFGIDNPSIDL